MSVSTVKWQGMKWWHELGVYPLNTSWNPLGGIYVMCWQGFDGKWVPEYIGETQSFQERLCGNHHKWDAALRRGVTHIHAMVMADDEALRRVVERDLVSAWQPHCNVHLFG
jgi:hypothetical protein